MNELTEQETSEQLASPPGTVTVAGTTYLVEKFNTAQVFALYEWGVEQAKKLYNPFKEVCDSLAGLPVTPEQTSQLLMQAHQVKMSGEVPGDLVTKCLRSKEGVAFCLWILTRKHHAELTLEQCNAKITDENRIDVYVQMDQASGANIVNKAVTSAGFFPPASGPANTGSSATAAPR